ncbi:MAG TPA: lipase family protein [Candidatus Saccharimonadales bacterium]|nr:lipase family protein [Candidatus Saccharimonadales bacterium]
MKRYRTPLVSGLVLFLGLIAINMAALYFQQRPITTYVPPMKQSPAKHGQLVQIVSTQALSAEQAMAEARQNYGPMIAASPAVTRTELVFGLLDKDGREADVHARAYVPAMPISAVIVLAPGTTGIGDQCAPSVEQPSVHNWANYQSHALAYAARGFMVVVPDYEGHRDPARIHHYMSGELEGRAVLDSISASRQIPEASVLSAATPNFVTGYSQGGHSAFWADKINATYSPGTKIAGVIGWGPVMDVQETLADVTQGANINWFGPYVLYSYQNLYGTNYHIDRILQPRWVYGLNTDVTSHCIDSDIAYWGTHPDNVYTPDFLNNLRKANLPEALYGKLGQQLAANVADDATTATPKLINAGEQDNVVLPRQQAAAKIQLCQHSRGPVRVTLYPETTHYNAMVHSFEDSIVWMQQIMAGQTPAGNC